MSKKEEFDHEYLGFEHNLEDTDYGFILDKEGQLKGIWIPVDQEDKDVPDAIVRMLKEYWGVDPNEPEYYGTIH
tara:strand:- start:4331 stop:4552 length:222 start_codon:yes stop_codon:yes gene_type:complete